jgi:amino acid adenylation domain-containing protein/non-ribosomal peptide synthase protein (TIGR01720 family)
MIDRHDSLRSYYELDEEGLLIQKSHNSDFEKYFSVENDVLLTDIQCVGAFVRPFNLNKDHLFRAKLVKFYDSKRGLLMFDFHHIICDGLSINIFLKELSQLYNDDPLTTDLVQYTDYCNWIHDNNKFNEDIDYWIDQVSDAPKLNMFTDHVRPAKQSFEGGVVSLDIESCVEKQLNIVCRSHHITPYMLYLSVYSILLGKISGKEDIIIGSPFSGRPHPSLENTLGMFVNTLPLRCKPYLNKKISTYFQEIKQIVVDAHTHQNFLFEDLVNRVLSEKDLSHHPLFDCMIDVQPVEQNTLDFSSVSTRYMALDNPTVKSDLMLSVISKNYSNEKNSRLSLGYAKSLYQRETVEVILNSLYKLLKHCLYNQDDYISNCLLVSDNKLQSVVYGNSQKIDENVSLKKLFEEQVSKTPNKTAVSSGHVSLTYSDLNIQANRVANYLKQNNIDKGDVVIQQLDRSEKIAICFFAILKIGAVYLPLEPNIPDDRLLDIISSSGAKAIIRERNKIKSKPDISSVDEILDINVDDLSSLEEFSEASPFYVPKRSDIAYIIYTSGTTGKPKGVAVNQGSLLNLTLWLIELMYNHSIDTNRTNKNQDRGASSKVVLLNASVQFDASLQHLLAPVLSGAEVIIASDEAKKDPYKLIEILKTKNVDTADFTPSHLTALCSYADHNNIELPLLNVLVGGEKLLPETARLFYNITDKRSRLYNVYGVTEAAVDSTYELIKRDAKEITVGRPLPNRMLCVLDAAGYPMPRLIPGLLHEAGAGLAVGYVNDDDLTKDKFKETSLGVRSSEYNRLYNTGDIAKITQDGKLIILGRKDTQTKIKGYRIELDEIRVKLNQVDCVEEGFVTVNDVNDSPTLCAFYIRNKSCDDVRHEDETKLIIKQLECYLPFYMIPSLFVPVDEFFRNRNGKIDKNKLPLPLASMRQRESNTEVANQLEAISVKLWSNLLGLKSVDRETSFFALGGDSIKAIQLASRWRKNGYVMSMDDFFRFPTISNTSEYVLPERKSIDQAPVIGSVQFSPIQHNFIKNNFQKPEHWNQAVLLETATDKTRIDINKIKKAVDALVAHHDILRSKLGSDDQCLYIPDLNDFDFHILEKEVSEKTLTEEFNFVQSSIVLKDGPLLKVAIFTSETKQYLLLVAHHLIVDAVSWRIILEDLLTIYMSDQTADAGSLLPRKTTSYRDWSESIKSYANSIAQRDIDYWRNTIVDLHDKKIPKDNNVITKAHCSREINPGFEIDETLVDKMFSQANLYCSLAVNDVLLTAFYLATVQWRNKRSLTLTLESHGRLPLAEDHDLSRTVGWFTSVYPIRFENEAVDLNEQLKIIKSTLDTVPDMGVSYGALKYCTNHFAGLTNGPADLETKISFNYLGKIDLIDTEIDSSQSHSDAGESMIIFPLVISRLDPGDTISKDNNLQHDIQIEGNISEGKLQFYAIYNSNVYEGNDISRLLKLFKEMLCELIDHFDNIENNSSELNDDNYSAVGLDEDDVANIFDALDI